MGLDGFVVKSWFGVSGDLAASLLSAPNLPVLDCNSFGHLSISTSEHRVNACGRIQCILLGSRLSRQKIEWYIRETRSGRRVQWTRTVAAAPLFGQFRVTEAIVR